MSNRRKPLYSGVLNQPIIPGSSGLLLVGPKEAIDRSIANQRSGKLDLLLVHYGIRSKKPMCWRELAARLAMVHVPGMRVINRPGKGKGAPRKLDSGDRELAQIEKIRRERGKGINDAIRIGKKRNLLEGNVRSLERRYYETKRKSRELEAQFSGRSLPAIVKLESMPGFEELMTVVGKKPTRREQELIKRQFRFREIGVGPAHKKPAPKKNA